VLSAFAGVALLIAVVGVAGVLAFTVSARTREFGVRLAIGLAPRHLLARSVGGGAHRGDRDRCWHGRGTRSAASPPAMSTTCRCRAPWPCLPRQPHSCMGAAVVTSLVPAVRASRVDLVQALRPE
jgi:putative ABC transport system permease protein